MRDMPPWFKCLVWMEVALQLPFFFVGAYAFLLRRNWIRTPALLYGINVTSTMVRHCSLPSVPMAPAGRVVSPRMGYHSALLKCAAVGLVLGDRSSGPTGVLKASRLRTFT